MSADGMLAQLLRVIEVERPGMQTSVQDVRGRRGYWEVGVPPSGAMDGESLRLANVLVGNPGNAAGLEVTKAGPLLRFPAGGLIAVCGARTEVAYDGRPVPMETVVRISPGESLDVGNVQGPGVRSYLAVRGGIAVPEVLGSRSTFIAGTMGGVDGRPLITGDVLEIGRGEGLSDPPPGSTSGTGRETFTGSWDLEVTHGPHGAPDLLTPDGLAKLLAGPWTVHRHSDRTGVRLSGPKMEFARSDGGVAGLHPSNVIETPYAIGAIMLSGDTPIIVGPDGPSLGGFCAPLCVSATDLWKLGQLGPGDEVRLAMRGSNAEVVQRAEPPEAVIARDEFEGRPSVQYRRAGDENLIAEFGDAHIDFAYRFSVHALQQAILGERIPGVSELTPGFRCLQIRFDPTRIDSSTLLDRVRVLEEDLPSPDRIVVPSRTVTMPLSWEDPEVVKAMEIYHEKVNPEAPWCPDNIEFIRRINGLESREQVKDMVFDAGYLVVGLGDVYLGAPVALPINPVHQLVTTKYTPARTWTPENAVGIGGAFLCIYGMEGPGGYQLFGRTVPVWSRIPDADSPPWLLRHFDRIAFDEVSADELLRLRAAAREGRNVVSISEGQMTLSDLCETAEADVVAARAHGARREAAFERERRLWASDEPAEVRQKG